MSQLLGKVDLTSTNAYLILIALLIYDPERKYSKKLINNILAVEVQNWLRALYGGSEWYPGWNYDVNRYRKISDRQYCKHSPTMSSICEHRGSLVRDWLVRSARVCMWWHMCSVHWWPIRAQSERNRLSWYWTIRRLRPSLDTYITDMHGTGDAEVSLLVNELIKHYHYLVFTIHLYCKHCVWLPT